MKRTLSGYQITTRKAAGTYRPVFNPGLLLHSCLNQVIRPTVMPDVRGIYRVFITVNEI